nr:hypothetical protein CFP56_66106 [Quercus suber]
MYALESEAGEGFDSVGRLECRLSARWTRRRPVAVGVVVTGGTAVGIARGPESSSSSSIDRGGAHGRQSG